jgi:hypothetical protein
MRNQFIFIFFTLFSFQFGYSQIIEEGKGIDSITIGIKESKVTKFLGNNYNRKNIDDNEYILVYSKKALTIAFDKDSIVYEISIKPTIKRKTLKGLIITPKLKISDVEKVYGDEGWYVTADSTIDNGYDSGIVFRTNIMTKNKKKVEISDSLYLESKIIEIIIEQSENDYSFQEYIEGIYIPKNLTECYKEIDHFLKQSEKDNIKSKNEDEFTAEAHFGLGLWIRNNWALWKGSRLYCFFKAKGISHPDDMSGIILTSYYRKLNNTDIKLDTQIEEYRKYWAEKKKK